MSAWLFRWRGVVLGALGVAVAVVACPSSASVLAALPLLLVGLILRGWAFEHLGTRGRTRDPGAPAGRVVSGPYRWVGHPVYLANGLLAAGLIVSARLPGAVAWGMAGAAVLVYGTLAVRETQQVAAAQPRASAGLSLRAVVRSERSTWLSIAALLAAQILRGAGPA